MSGPALVNRSEAGDRLALYLLGGFRLALGERSLDENHWRLRKAKSLVKLLALMPEHRLHREQVMELLWPHLSTNAAAHNLHQVLYVARRTLESGEAKQPRFLQLQDDNIILAPEAPLWVDVQAFEAAAAGARRAKTSALYQAALALYTGDLLPDDLYEDWASARRESLKLEYISLKLELAQVYESAREFPQAIETLRQLLEKDPGLEAAHRALMRLYAAGGQRQPALRQYQLLREALHKELDAEPDPESQALYQDILASSAASSDSGAGSVRAAAQSLKPHLESLAKPARLERETAPNNLPVHLVSFVGRQRELADLKKRLPQTRFLTLTGPGGCGKTRLGLALAAESLAEFPEGIWWVELSTLAEPALVPQTVASVLGIREQPEVSLAASLAAFLKAKRVLLILDNCEHVVGGCAMLAESLLQACPSLQILATSQEILHVPGETNWRVPSLALPQAGAAPPLPKLLEYDGIQLFAERAQAVLPGFQVTAQNALPITEICRRLDGIPLAIELAAARVNVLSVDQVASRLDNRFRLLTGGSRTAIPRHQTLGAMVSWSYDLLSAPERTLWHRISVFAGGFSLEAAEQVTSDTWQVTSKDSQHSSPDARQPALAPSDILDLLSQLVGKSLVQVKEHDWGITFDVLETIRQYGQDKLIESGEAAAIHQRHCDYYVALAERTEAELQSPRQREWLTQLEMEHDNLNAALAWSGADESDSAAFLRLGAVLWSYWFMHGHLTEGRRWLEQALEKKNQAPKPVRGRLLLGAGALAWAQGEYAHATALSQESLALFQELDDRGWIALALLILGLSEQYQGDLAQAAALYEQGLALAREANAEFALGLALHALGMVAQDQADYGRATALLQESLSLKREIGDKWGTALSLQNLGNVARDQRLYSQASSYYHESLALFREIDNKFGMALCLNDLGYIAQEQGAYPQALSYLEESLELFRSIGDKLNIAACLELIANIALAQGAPERAARLLGAADSLRQLIGVSARQPSFAHHERIVDLAVAKLQAQGFSSAFAQGRSMPPEEAIQYAHGGRQAGSA